MAKGPTGAKKKKKAADEEHENAERWLLTYADLITLLFAFFVVLWAMSQVEQKKYEELTLSFQTVFQGANMGYVFNASNSRASQGSMDQGRQQVDPSKAKRDMRNKMVTELDQRMKNYIPQHQYDLTEIQDGLKITLYSDVFFAPGSADLPREAVPLMQKVVESLLELPNKVRVEGHTDQTLVPNKTYRDNWQLSSARSLAVINLMSSLGYPEEKLSSAAFGSNRPRVDNGTPEDQAFNRRVELVVLWDAGQQ